MNYFKSAEQLLGSIPALNAAIENINGRASHIAQASTKPKYSNVKSIEQYLECGLEEIELKRCLQRTKNLISDIERVLSQLDDEEQEILRLWYVDKKPKEQILAAMHIESLSTPLQPAQQSSC